ncbi:hypothetical protein EDB80DRAFT_682778 [Ilyonectria destructans]|nr:hypothetical protein EDB80DRAFT_682778 [Ilyonectria destructans]
MKMNQTAQQSQAQFQATAQAQAQAQIKQMQGQPGMDSNIPPVQSLAVNIPNTPVSRSPNNMNPIGNQGIGQGATQFGDQRLNQQSQRPYSQAFQNMLQNLTQEQQSAVRGLAPEKLDEVIRRWETKRQSQMAGAPGNISPQIQVPRVPNIPAHVLQVSPQELMHVRNQRPNLANVPDEQLRMMVMQMKRQSWMTQQQMRGQQAQSQTVQPPGFKRPVSNNNRDRYKSRLTSIRRDKSSVVDKSHIKSSSKTLQVDDTQKIRPPQNTQQASKIFVPLPELIEPSKKNVSQHVVYTISEDYTDLERVRKSRLCSLTSSSTWKESGQKF